MPSAMTDGPIFEIKPLDLPGGTAKQRVADSGSYCWDFRSSVADSGNLCWDFSSSVADSGIICWQSGADSDAPAA
jgi:hypothetical protein